MHCECCVVIVHCRLFANDAQSGVPALKESAHLIIRCY